MFLYALIRGNEMMHPFFMLPSVFHSSLFFRVVASQETPLMFDGHNENDDWIGRDKNVFNTRQS